MTQPDWVRTRTTLSIKHDLCISICSCDVAIKFLCGYLFQIDSLRNKYEIQEAELFKSRKQAQEAMDLVAEESAKFAAAKDVIKSLTSQVVSR